MRVKIKFDFNDDTVCHHGNKTLGKYSKNTKYERWEWVTEKEIETERQFFEKQQDAYSERRM